MLLHNLSVLLVHSKPYLDYFWRLHYLLLVKNRWGQWISWFHIIRYVFTTKHSNRRTVSSHFNASFTHMPAASLFIRSDLAWMLHRCRLLDAFNWAWLRANNVGLGRRGPFLSIFFACLPHSSLSTYLTSPFTIPYGSLKAFLQGKAGPKSMIIHESAHSPGGALGAIPA